MDGSPSHASQPISSSSSRSFENDDFASELNYYGIKKRSYFKSFRKDIIQLTSYILSVSPSFTIAHNIMSVIRVLQFCLPCFIPAYTTFWKRGTIDQMTMNALAVFYYLIPPSAVYVNAKYLLLVYILIQALMTIIIVGSSFYFKKYAKLPGFIPPFIYFYQSTFGYYLHPIIFYSVCAGISFLITAETRGNVYFPRFLALSIASVICICFNFFFMSIFTSQTIVFRPISLASTVSEPQYFIIISTILINIFFSIAISLQKTYKIVFLLLNIILYIISSFSVFVRGGFIDYFVSNIVLTSSISGAVFTTLDLILIILDKNGTIAILFSFIVFYILLIILNFFILRSYDVKQLNLLDLIKEDPACFSYIKSINQYLQLATCGIKNAHPVIIDLSFFKLGIEKWPTNEYVYLIYAKFIAIFPEETTTLKFILKTIKLQKISGSTFRSIKDQSRTIMKQRETNLTNELKLKISSIKKDVQSTKHKLGHVLDVVIRGNSNEIEDSTKKAITAINNTNTDYKHLLREYPNNRNVTYYYSLFLYDVLADHQLSQEMYNRTKLLHPGFVPIEDQTHEFGLKTFPNLPKMIETQKDQPVMVTSTAEIAQVGFDPNEYESRKDHQRNLDQIAGIKFSIMELRIPSAFWSKIIRILVTLLIFVIPCIVGLIMIDYYSNKLQRPLKFIGALSMLRALSYQVIGFSLRYIGESFNIFEVYANQTRIPPRSFGYTWNTKKQLEFILTLTTQALQDFDSFRKFEEDNYYINKARDLIFQNTVPYRYFTSPTNYTDSNISIQAAILDYTIQQKTILTAFEINESILSSGTVLNPINNAYSISMNTRDALDLLILYIGSNYEHIKKVGKIVLIVLIIFSVLAYSITLIIEIKWLNSNKQETYQCLFSLPKNVVSELAEKLDTKKSSDNQAEEMNKQDENILKIFNSGISTESSYSDVLQLIAGSVFILIFAICSIVLFIQIIFGLTESVKNSAPHLHYLQSAYTNLLSSMNYLHIILFEFGGYPIPTMSFNYSMERMTFNFERASYYYHFLNTGGPSFDEVPFRKFIEGINNAFVSNCSISTSDKTDLLSIFECSPVDMTIVLIEPIIMYTITPYQKGAIDTLDPKNPHYQSIWIHLMTPIYDLFFEPMHDQIIPSIDSDLSKIRGKYIPFILLLLFLVIIIEVLLYMRINDIEGHIRSVLLILLHCKPSSIFSSAKITRILAGDFSVQQNDSLERNSAFFDTVVTSLPNAIMYANTDMIIQSANESCKRTFNDNEIVGKNIRDFFLSNRFSGNVENLFVSVNTNPTEEIAYKTGNTELIFKATSMMACGKFVITCQNVTQSHNYNTLILEEKLNSDKLLSTILPPSLVSRVQEGEKNISFSVQSASILFSDIVSFTPWCSSLPEETVMRSLNILFKRFDSILDTKPTMTKIKCIGDCYMAAGGIFAEVNQPVLHAKEVVSFGLQSIKEVVLINQEINQNLKIRVGVNTGGPIVAGVLGIGKPTFEILGPAINRAQQMEQSGTQMMVHISSAVYELICGLNFKFSNRRQVECKNEMVETYLVEP